MSLHLPSALEAIPRNFAEVISTLKESHISTLSQLWETEKKKKKNKRNPSLKVAEIYVVKSKGLKSSPRETENSPSPGLHVVWELQTGWKIHQHKAWNQVNVRKNAGPEPGQQLLPSQNHPGEKCPIDFHLKYQDLGVGWGCLNYLVEDYQERKCPLCASIFTWSILTTLYSALCLLNHKYLSMFNLASYTVLNTCIAFYQIYILYMSICIYIHHIWWTLMCSIISSLFYTYISSKNFRR